MRAASRIRAISAADLTSFTSCTRLLGGGRARPVDGGFVVDGWWSHRHWRVQLSWAEKRTEVYCLTSHLIACVPSRIRSLGAASHDGRQPGLSVEPNVFHTP